MAHTEVFVSNDAGVLMPSIPCVTVNESDTVAFSNNGPDAIFAFFSPGASAVLSPTPAGAVPLSGSDPTVFTFTSSDPGSYSVYFETSASAPVPDFPGGSSNLLRMEIDSDGAGFGGLLNRTRGG